MAKAASRPDVCANYQNEEKLWLQIADRIDADDKAQREASHWPGYGPK